MRDLAEEWEDDSTARQLIDRRHAARRRRRFAVAAGFAAAMLLAVVSLVGVLGEGTSEDSVVPDGRDGASPTTITTTTSQDPSTLTLDREQVAVASAVVTQFLHELRLGELSAGWTTAFPVVTVTLPSSGDRPLAAIAFLVDAPPTGPDDEDSEEAADERAARRGARIQRISVARSPESVPASGSVVEAGQEIVIPGVPVEGGARGFVNGTEVPVDVDHEALTMTLRIPESTTGDVVVTLSSATPELPTADAFAYTVRPS